MRERNCTRSAARFAESPTEAAGELGDVRYDICSHDDRLRDIEERLERVEHRLRLAMMASGLIHDDDEA